MPEFVTFEGVIAPQLNPGEMVSENETFPVKPLIGETLIVDVPRALALTVTAVWLEATVKSWTW